MGTYTPDELNETESFDSGDLENRALDDSTYEPGLQVETSGDFEMSEKIESALKNMMENVSTDYVEDVRLNIEDLITSAEAKLNEIKVEITTAGNLPEEEESSSPELVVLKPDVLPENDLGDMGGMPGSDMGGEIPGGDTGGDIPGDDMDGDIPGGGGSGAMKAGAEVITNPNQEKANLDNEQPG